MGDDSLYTYKRAILYRPSLSIRIISSEKHLNFAARVLHFYRDSSATASFLTMLRNLRQSCRADINEITPSKTPPETNTDKRSANLLKSSSFRDILKRGNEEVLIAVMGVTGSGKSYFCHTATGGDIFRVSDELDSCMCIIKVGIR